MERKPSRISAQEFETAVRQTIPLSEMFPFRVECLEAGFARLRVHFDERQIRAGGTISGPVIMTLAERVFIRLLRVAMRRSDLLSVRCTLPSSFLASQRSRRLMNTL
jgi:acyl-coenzyme A thioesterase PaaI-like protein